MSTSADRLKQIEEMTLHPKVIEGNHQELFLATYKHYVERYLVGDKQIADGSFRNFEQNLIKRKAIADELGAQFIHLVGPDKQSVYRDLVQLPSLLRLGELYQSRVKAPFFYPLQALITQTTLSDRAYSKNDLHWNAHGVALVIGLLLEQLNHPNPEQAMAWIREKIIIKTDMVLGLGAVLVPQRVEDASVFNWRHSGIKKATNRRSGYGQMLWVKNSQATSKQRVLAFGDSFMLSLIYALSGAYEEILFVRSQFFHEDLMRDYRPDILITSSAEGYLCRVIADRHALAMPAFIEKYGPLDRYDPALLRLLSHFIND